MDNPFVRSLLEVFQYLLNFGLTIIIASVIVSWVGGDPNNQVVRLLHAITEPVYRPIRRFTRNLPGPLDWAPMIASMAIVTLLIIIKNLLHPVMMPMGGGLP